MTDSNAWWQPFTPTAYTSQRGYRTIVSGEGIRVRDSNGRTLIDGTAGLWCVNIGHGRAQMAQAIAAQARKLAFYSGFEYRTGPAVELADRLRELAPARIRHFFFTSGGSESVDTAIKIARAYRVRRGEKGRTKIISRDLAYHGVCVGGTSLSGMLPMRPDFEPLMPHALRISHPHCFQCAFGLKRDNCELQCATQLASVVETEGPATVCAFIMEPVMGAGGVIPPPDGYIERVSEICRRHGVLLVVDDVICGFGRLGHWFSAGRFKMEPDMVIFAKGLTSGYVPLGGIGVSSEIYEAFVDAEARPVPELPHGFTYSGHPVGCAAALENIRIMEAEGIPRHVLDTEEYFASAMSSLAKLGRVRQTRAIGFMAAVDYGPEAPPDFARRVADEAYERGLITRAVRTCNVISPPLVMRRDDVDEIAGIFTSSITAAG
jgi:adenosylmethionine-8-amino-7-oxononanoate aminotransferase